MNYKKKYEEAERLYQTANADQRYVLESLFPKLRESEDEKVRKEIMEYVKNTPVAPEGHIEQRVLSRWLAWLEKQGKQKTVWHNEDEEPKRGSLILLIMQSGTPIVAKIIEPNHTFNHGERWAYIDDLLEKQGEKSSTVDIESMIEAYEQRLIDQGNGVRNSPIVNMCMAAFKHGVENTLDELHLKQGETSQILSNSSNIGKDEQKSDWSNNEKLMLADIIEATERSNIFMEDYQRELVDWLKFLKQRIGGE